MVRNSKRSQSAELGLVWNNHRQVPQNDVPENSTVPLLSVSISLIISCNSDSEGFRPSDCMTTPNSGMLIFPGCQGSAPLLAKFGMISMSPSGESGLQHRELFEDGFSRVSCGKNGMGATNQGAVGK